MRKIIPLFFLLGLFTFINSQPAIAAESIVSYQTIETNGGVAASTGQPQIPKMVSDGVFLYVLTTSGDQAMAARYEIGLKLWRKRINSNEDFRVIWEKQNGVYIINGGIVLDKQGRLHLFYVKHAAAFEGYLQHEIASSPQANNVSFVPDTAQPLSGRCSSCRLGITYENSTDSLYIVFEQRKSDPLWATSYLALYKNGTWSTPEAIVDMPKISNNTHIGYEYTYVGYFYPRPIVFKNRLHIFYVVHPFSLGEKIKWFKSIVHYYRPLSGGPWTSETIRDTVRDVNAILNDPRLQSIEGNFFDDVFITGNNELAIIGTYRNCPSKDSTGNYNCNIAPRTLQAVEYTNAAGVGNWQQNVLYPSNYQICIQKTADGLYHSLRISSNLIYAQSADGKSWVDKTISQIPNLTLYNRACLKESGYSHNKFYFMVESSSHTVVLGTLSLINPSPTPTPIPTRIPTHVPPSSTPTTIPPTATRIPPTVTITPTPIPGDITGPSGISDRKVDMYDYNLLITDFGRSGSPADINRNGTVDIFDYNILVGNFGKTS